MMNRSMVENTTTTAPNSVFDAGLSRLTAGGAANRLGKSHTAGKGERSPNSRYRFIPTENAKFRQFLDLMLKSKMTKDEITSEITKYVQALETNYMETIKELKLTVDKERMKSRKVTADRVNENTEKNELESLFVDCIEEVRKDIMKRRLKNEIYNKKFQQASAAVKNTDEAREFEESLLRLAQLAKNKVKLTDFTVRDKCNLLDLFVNNEKTLLKIYEALFPHRAGAQPSGAQGGGNPMIHTNAAKEKQITLRNSQISHQLAQSVANSGGYANYVSAHHPHEGNQSLDPYGGGLPMIGG